jgi:TRAP-type C4-dicarboxylate transport system substrate-binding protein
MRLSSNRFGSLLTCALLCLVFSPGVPAKTLRLGLITPPSHIWTQAAHNLARDIEDSSGGRHTLIVYPSRQLGNEAQMLQLMQTGALDMAILTAAEVSNRVPAFGALYTPYLARNIEQAAQVLRGRVAASLLDLLPQEIGVIGLGYGMAGLRQILSTIPVSSLADMQGRKLRITPFEPIRDFYKLAGVAPTPMPLASVYDALANGQIDMLDMDLELILKLKYHELSDTLVISNHMMFPSVAMLSGRVWIRLSEEDRQMISGLTAKHMDWVIDQAVHEEAAWQAGVRKLDTGLKILDVGPEFFGNTAADWETIWAPKAGVISALRSELENAAN